jgi:uncharacterized spore protein YtfJ
VRVSTSLDTNGKGKLYRMHQVATVVAGEAVEAKGHTKVTLSSMFRRVEAGADKGTSDLRKSRVRSAIGRGM